MTTDVRALESLMTTIRQELERPSAERSTGATDTSLALAASQCQAAVDAAIEGRADEARGLLRSMARRAVDEWSLTSPVTVEVASRSQEMTR